MYLGIKFVPLPPRPKCKRMKRMLILECDSCSAIFNRDYTKIGREKKQYHFCSYDCQTVAKRQNGLMNELSKQTCLDRFGVENAFQLTSRIKTTMLKRYGVENIMQNSIILAKRTKTNVMRYGGPSPMSSSIVRSKFDWVAKTNKSHQTRKRNKTYGTSKEEEICFEHLCNQHGVENVERHVIINNWEIDFYIKSINVYVQYDGCYYHGTNRPIDVIKEFKTPTDKVIYSTWLRDAEQVKWFEEQKLRLVRIKEKVTESNFPKCLQRILKD